MHFNIEHGEAHKNREKDDDIEPLQNLQVMLKNRLISQKGSKDLKEIEKNFSICEP